MIAVGETIKNLHEHWDKIKKEKDQLFEESQFAKKEDVNKRIHEKINNIVTVIYFREQCKLLIRELL